MKAHNGWKICSRCHENKPVGEYHKNKRQADGLSYYCSKCASEAAKKHYAKNTDKIKVRVKAYAGANKTKVAARQRAYREAHREEIRAYMQDYVREHREEINANKRVWVTKHRDKNREYGRRYRAKLGAREDSEIRSPTAKYCPKCRKTKPASEFPKCRSKPDGLSSICKACHADLSHGAYRALSKVDARAEYRATLALYRQRHGIPYPTVRNANYRLTWRPLLAKWGFGICSVCGATKNICAHHTEEEKNFDVGKWISCRPITEENIEILEAELKLCIPLCRACHNAEHRRLRAEQAQPLTTIIR